MPDKPDCLSMPTASALALLTDILLTHQLSVGDVFAPRGHLAISGDTFGWQNLEGLLVASSAQAPVMLLNIPQRPGQPP